MKRSKTIFVLLIAISLTFVSVWAFSVKEAFSQKSELDKLVAAEDVYEDPKDYEKRLIGILRDGKLRQSERKKVVGAIIKLGDMRSVAAIDDLVKLLNFKRTFPQDKDVDVTESHPISLTGRYPAGGALLQIGKPALAALVKVIESHKCSDVESQVASETIIGILRDNYAEAAKFLREIAAKSAFAETKQCFNKTAQKADKLAALIQKN
jgi:hypothetical protein